jgi:hypothetical protein
MTQSNLRAGVARVDITPPVPIDCVGFVRRADPVVDVLAPLNATALVVEDESTGNRAVIVAFDLIGIDVNQGRRIRQEIADTVGCSPDSVLLNYSHTHAAPHPFDEHPKLGGSAQEISASNANYIESLPFRLASAAFMAVREMVPVRIGAASGLAEGIAVNRRERLPDGRTVLGWNPEGVSDPEVSVVRIDHLDGNPLAVIVGFACHPVVLGGENPFIGPDFPGVVREVIESNTDALCLFLQGAAGDILPLEGFYEEEGPEQAFGERIALEALAAFSRIRSTETDIERIDGYGSVTPTILYRHTPRDPQAHQPVLAAARLVRFPLKPLPTVEEVESELVEYQRVVNEAKANGAPRSQLNPLEHHVHWAERVLPKLREGTAEEFVEGVLQVIRIGDVAFTAVPGEPFNEIGLAVKEQSVAPYTVFCGYSNEYIAYFPTAAEYPYGGYEPGYSHHNSARAEQVGPECESLIVDTLVELVDELFETGSRS